MLVSKVSTFEPGIINYVTNDGMFSTIDIETVKDFLIKLEENEARFLLKFPMDKRIKKHQRGKFRIIRDLGVGQECRLRGNASFYTYVIQRKYDDKDGMKFDLTKKVFFRYNRGNIHVSLQKKSGIIRIGVDASEIKLDKVNMTLDV